ncbi:hypothetical protein CHI95_19645 [Providencia rettgeri]|uniref:Uncharacterized protein n=1 Tax=Providencia rettgeri TaxID=587 RepID=A0A264VNG5_PRORE|nr:hypothetical protein [Providencia rettgeri]OZS72896.1 hypothetical protein CHI95_19645 [Providencia rettgeri]
MKEITIKPTEISIRFGLDFFIEERSGIWVKEWFAGGCTPATDEEVKMWGLLAFVLPPAID